MYVDYSLLSFYTRDGRWLVNEMAPRPHNSGHVTMESCTYSQYAQHLRGILNLPLHTPESLHTGIMVNLVGAEGHPAPLVLKELISYWESVGCICMLMERPKPVQCGKWGTLL